MRCQLIAIVLAVFFLGCEGAMDRSQVEQFVREELELTTMTLKSTGDNGYEGTGADAGGITYKLIVKQVPGGIKLSWSTSTGNGDVSFGKPVP